MSSTMKHAVRGSTGQGPLEYDAVFMRDNPDVHFSTFAMHGPLACKTEAETEAWLAGLLDDLLTLGL